MVYRTLIAHLSSVSVVSPVLEAASMLADQNSAHLIGLHIQPPMELYTAEVPYTAELSRHFQEHQMELAGNIRSSFEKVTATQSYVAEWRVASSVGKGVSNIIAEYANTADLVIMSRSEGENTDTRFKHIPEHVLMTSGRPGIVVPEKRSITSIGERVLLAWDGRRESTRAVFNALPILKTASEVRLLRVNLPYHDRHHCAGITDELARSLARHDVNVELTHADARGSEVGDEILGYARDMDADLLVMGCYGHSPFREFIFGGTTRQILHESPIPMFLSN